MKDRRAHGKYLIEEEKKNANPKKTQIKNKSTTKPTEDIRNRKKNTQQNYIDMCTTTTIVYMFLDIYLGFFL